MKTRRIICKNRKNKTISNRNKKTANKRVYRRKTMKGGVGIERLSVAPSPDVNQKLQTLKDTRQFKYTPTFSVRSKTRTYVPKKTRGLEKGIKVKYDQQYQEKQDAKKTANEELQQYKDLQSFKKSYDGLLTNYITEIPVIQVLNLVFEKYPMKRFSSYFGKNAGARQQSKIQELDNKLKGELCLLDNTSELGNCSTGFTADQWANSEYCKINYNAKSGMRYWDTGNKLCEYIPYAMKQIEKDYSKLNNENHTLLFKMNNGTFYFDWSLPENYMNLLDILNETKDTSLEKVNESDCLVNMPEYNWKLQRKMEIVSDNTDVSIQITVPLFAMIYSSFYSKISESLNSNDNVLYSTLRDYTQVFHDLLNSCVPTSESENCLTFIETFPKGGILESVTINNFEKIMHQINRNILIGNTFNTYLVTNTKIKLIDLVQDEEKIVPNNQTVSTNRKLKEDIQQPWKAQLSSIYNAIITSNELYNQRLVFLIYMLPYFYEQVNTETQLILAPKGYALQQLNKVGENALSIFENSKMYSFFVNKIKNTQGVSPEKGAVTNDHYNLFVKRNGTKLQFTFYAMFVVVSMDDPEKPVAYCLSELMFGVDLNDPNFEQHLLPSESLVNCENTNQDYYANYPKMSILNYIQPYE